MKFLKLLGLVVLVSACSNYDVYEYPDAAPVADATTPKADGSQCQPICQGRPCGCDDTCGATCQLGSGCEPQCEPKCSRKSCGQSDGCGGTCRQGSGCSDRCSWDDDWEDDDDRCDGKDGKGYGRGHCKGRLHRHQVGLGHCKYECE